MGAIRFVLPIPWEGPKTIPLDGLSSTGCALETAPIAARSDYMQVNLSTIIGQWRPFAARLAEWNRAVPSFGHLRTAHARDSADEGLQHGHIVWGKLGGPHPMALCWEWAEVRAGVVAIFN